MPKRNIENSPILPKRTRSDNVIATPSKRECLRTPKRALSVTPKKNLETPQTPKTPLSMKRCLSTAENSPIKERDTEMEKIRSFINCHMKLETAASLYISGKPGTGKTACMNEILSTFEGEKIIRNCMAIDNPKALYFEMLRDINARTIVAKSPSKTEQSLEHLEKVITDKKRKMLLLILDEIDQLHTRELDVFQRIFLWPTLPGSRIVLIGISNVLDFTNGLIARLNFPATCKPEVLHFQPYSAPQIKAIIKHRIFEASDHESVALDENALELCARKIAATTGDIRTALKAFQCAINLAQQEAKRVRLNPPEASVNSGPSLEPIKEENSLSTPVKVKAAHVFNVLSAESKAVNAGELPLQQRLLVCCAILARRENKVITIGKLTDLYKTICPAHQLHALDSGEIINLCHILSERRIFSLTKHPQIRLSKVILLSEDEAEFHLAGKVLLGAILNSPQTSNAGKELE